MIAFIVSNKTIPLAANQSYSSRKRLPPNSANYIVYIKDNKDNEYWHSRQLAYFKKKLKYT